MLRTVCICCRFVNICSPWTLCVHSLQAPGRWCVVPECSSITVAAERWHNKLSALNWILNNNYVHYALQRARWAGHRVNECQVIRSMSTVKCWAPTKLMLKMKNHSLSLWCCHIFTNNVHISLPARSLSVIFRGLYLAVRALRVLKD